MAKNKDKKELFKRKDPDCTSFYFVLCGERLKKVAERQKQYFIDTGKDTLSHEAAVNLIILGKWEMIY